MASKHLSIPAHFTPEKASEIWRVEYQKLAERAHAWADTHDISPAAQDEKKIALLLIDVQNTFCIPGFELFVGGRSGTGAVDDTRRLCEFIYRNIHRIHRIIPTLDTHHAMQIFHSMFFVNDAGGHPAPFSMISAIDISAGKWRFNEALAPYLGKSPKEMQRHLQYYTNVLRDKGKFTHTVWPYHAMLGGIGHALVPLVEEAIFFHSMARYSQPDFQPKGSHPLTENYSILRPEVITDADGNTMVDKNKALVRDLLTYDAIIIAGQAKSHCVNWTVADLLSEINEADPNLAKKVYLLEDCSSPVVIPDVVDFTDMADAAYREFEDAGMNIVQSTDDMNEWLKIG